MVSGITFLHCDHIPQCRATVGKVFDYYSIQFATGGPLELRYGETYHRLAGPTVWPHFPGPYTSLRRLPGCGDWDHRYTAYSGPATAELLEYGLLPTAPVSIPAGDAGRFAAHFDELISLARRTGSRERLRATNCLERILLDVADLRSSRENSSSHGSTPPGDRSMAARLNRVRAALEDTSTEPDYAALSRSCGIALSTLRRKFREATGVSLHEHRLRALTIASRALLARSDLPIKAVADVLGYSDVFYFTRQFTRRVGVSPAAFRRSAMRDETRSRPHQWRAEE